MFTYCNPLVHKLTNLFKNTNVNIAFRSAVPYFNNYVTAHSNTLPHLVGFTNYNAPPAIRHMSDTPADQSPSDIQHVQYIRTNSPTSAYALHILSQCHDYGSPPPPPDKTLHLLRSCEKGNIMNCWESFYIQQLHHCNQLTDEQQPSEHNPLYALCWETQHSTAPQTSTQSTQVHVPGLCPCDHLFLSLFLFHFISFSFYLSTLLYIFILFYRLHIYTLIVPTSKYVLPHYNPGPQHSCHTHKHLLFTHYLLVYCTSSPIVLYCCSWLQYHGFTILFTHCIFSTIDSVLLCYLPIVSFWLRLWFTHPFVYFRGRT
jgi:hypothetical protein